MGIKKIQLIYIDPPYFTNKNFYNKNKELAYSDKWEGKTYEDKLVNYLLFLYHRLKLMKELLSDTGTIYVHLDYRMVHFVKIIMDEIFGRKSFRNEIIWHYGGRGSKVIATQFPRNHDTILVYSKMPDTNFNKIFTTTKISIYEAHKHGFKQDNKGRWFKTAPKGNYTNKHIKTFYQQDRIYITKNGNIRIKYFLKEENGFILEKKRIGDVWDDIPDNMHIPKQERLNYPTQKPEKLLERIILASSNKNDIVTDFFCGSGTTLKIAYKLKRRFIGSDNSLIAIKTTRERLKDINYSYIEIK